MLGTVRNWRRWSEIIAVALLDNESGKIALVNMLSISVFGWIVILTGCKTYGMCDLGGVEGRQSFYSKKMNSYEKRKVTNSYFLFLYSEVPQYHSI